MDGSIDYQSLSDIELIARYCDAEPEQAAFEELWRRYEPTGRKFAKHLAYLCPPSYSRDIFIEEVFSATQYKVLQGIRQYEGRVSFSGWLYRITERAALDLQRKIRGRGPQPVEFVELSEGDLEQQGAVFRDKIKHEPVHHAILTERRALLDDILDRHAASEDGYRSLAAITFHFLDDCRVREVAELLGTYERDVFRLFTADYRRLRAALAARGIKCISDALTRQE